jgi:heptaprenyl diphosphate synthase
MGENMKKSVAGKVAYYGIFVSLAFVFSFVEVLVPISLGIPGIKLGLANIVVLTALYAMGPKDAFFISCVRVVLVGFTFGNMAALLYSLAGGLLSWLVMCLLKRIKGFSMIGVSLAGGIAHNIGQIFVAGLMLKTSSVIYYLPVLLIAGTVTGVLIGILGGILLKAQLRLKNTIG